VGSVNRLLRGERVNRIIVMHAGVRTNEQG